MLNVALETVIPRSPPRPSKASIDYLIACGCTAISITARGGVAALHARIDPDAVSVLWLSADRASSIARMARKIAGERPDVVAMAEALHRAASEQRVTLTEHRTAIERAESAALQLHAFMEALREGGQLRCFNALYKAARSAASAEGRGFMTYSAALARLRLALVPYLACGKGLRGVQGLFAEVLSSTSDQSPKGLRPAP